MGPKHPPFPSFWHYVYEQQREESHAWRWWLPRGPWGKNPAKFTSSVIHSVECTGCAFSNMALHWLEETLCVDSPERFWLNKSKRKTKKVVDFSTKLLISVLYSVNLWGLK